MSHKRMTNSPRQERVIESRDRVLRVVFVVLGNGMCQSPTSSNGWQRSIREDSACRQSFAFQLNFLIISVNRFNIQPDLFGCRAPKSFQHFQWVQYSSDSRHQGREDSLKLDSPRPPIALSPLRRERPAASAHADVATRREGSHFPGSYMVP